MGRSVSGSVGRFVTRSVGWSVGRSVGWLGVRSVGRSLDGLVGGPVAIRAQDSHRVLSSMLRTLVLISRHRVLSSMLRTLVLISPAWRKVGDALLFAMLWTLVLLSPACPMLCARSSRCKRVMQWLMEAWGLLCPELKQCVAAALDAGAVQL